MRAEDDLTYQEYKENVEDAMRYIKNHGWTPRQVTDRMTDEDNELLIGTSEALWIISIGAYEVEHDILEERVLEQLSYHIPRYEIRSAMRIKKLTNRPAALPVLLQKTIRKQKSQTTRITKKKGMMMAIPMQK